MIFDITPESLLGSYIFVVLLQNNIDEFLVRLPVVRLSKTFRDAMIIARTLGYRYLWIDSLCGLGRLEKKGSEPYA
jgi:hypothetical protein